MATSPILRTIPEACLSGRQASRPQLQTQRARAKQTSLTLFPTAARHGNCELPSGASAPPPVPDQRRKPARELVGIARLAASSLCADAKRGTEYFLLPVKSILNHCDSERVPFRWTVNPYRGCEFGCKYCYARYTHEYMDLDGGEFESKIYVKKDAGPLAERDLGTEKIWGEHIAIGTATDPYQPAESEFGATRAILEKMAEREGLSLSITTKSNRVLRDIDLLKRISERSTISIHMSMSTLRTRLARMLEPRAPRPDLRLDAVRKLRDAGIAAGINAMPILPGITDGQQDLDALVRAARDSGAQWIAGGVLFLMPSSLKQFMPFLEQKFPKLVRQYQAWYARHAYAPDAYRKEIAERFEHLRRKYGVAARSEKMLKREWQSPQMQLGWETGGS
jgi:DNA repair photolyase